MAKLTSSVGYASRVRDRTDARNALSIPSINTNDDLPHLEIEIKSKERIFRLVLTPEETAHVVRLIYLSDARGMRKLRAQYEPPIEDILA